MKSTETQGVSERRQKGKTNFPLSVSRKAFATFQVLQITHKKHQKNELILQRREETNQEE